MLAPLVVQTEILRPRVANRRKAAATPSVKPPTPIPSPLVAKDPLYDLEHFLLKAPASDDMLQWFLNPSEHFDRFIMFLSVFSKYHSLPDALDEKRMKYRDLISSTLCENTASLSQFLQFLCELLLLLGKKYITRFSRQPHHMQFLDQLLELDWAILDYPVAQAYSEFVLSFISSHPQLTENCLHMLVKGLRYRQLSDIPDWMQPLCVPFLDINIIHKRMKSVLVALPSIVPSLSEKILPALLKTHPRTTEPPVSLECFFKCSLELSDLSLPYRLPILEIAVINALQLDVQFQAIIEELSDDEIDILLSDAVSSTVLHSPRPSHPTSLIPGSAQPTPFESEDEGITVEEHQSSGFLAGKEIVQKLDSLMEVLFSFLDRNANSDKLLFDLIMLFEKHIYLSLKSRIVQFLLFKYVAGSHFADIFLGYIVQKLLSGNTLSFDISKLSLAGYLGSFLARAKFLDISTVKHSLELILGWCENYVHMNPTSCSDVSVHEKWHHFYRNCMFYALSQAAIYIFCFRHAELIPLNDMELQKAMERLVYSRLNPLATILPEVASEFVSVCSETGYIYCDYLKTSSSTDRSSITQLSSQLPTLLSPEEQKALVDLETFFPFDPYLLPHSSKFIQDDIYISWKNK